MQVMLDSTNSDPNFMNTIITGVWVRPENQIFPPFSLQWKSDESTKHYLIKMLLAVNWRYWQTGKNSRMRMKVQGRLMQARFIEIYQVFAKKGRVRF